MRNGLVDGFEVLVHVGLDPSAAELDDGDDAAASKAGGPFIGGAEVGDVPGSGGERADLDVGGETAKFEVGMAGNARSI